jgi:3-hydroxybutyryl-CoA dehydratase
MNVKSRDFAAIRVGDKATTRKTVTDQDVRLFAQITGDVNPIHLDEEYAGSTFFKQRIAHGMLAGGIVGGVLANELPGPGTIYLSQTLQFKLPVYLGDTVEAEVEIIEKMEAKRRLRVRTVCRNQDGKVVLEGEALVQMT